MAIQNYDGIAEMLLFDAAPATGTDEVQTLTFSGSPTAGTFRLSFNRYRTAPLAYNADAAAVQAALEALPSVGAGNVECDGTLAGGMALTFIEDLGKAPQPLVSLNFNRLNDGDIEIEETTAGAYPSGLGAQAGQLAGALGKAYVNQGDETAPDWVELVPATGGIKSLKIPLVAATTTDPGAVCAVANPEGVRLIVISAQILVDTEGALGTATFGIAANGTTAASNIYSADLTVTGMGVSDFIVNNTPLTWNADEFITGTASASVAGLEASLYVQYIRA